MDGQKDKGMKDIHPRIRHSLPPSTYSLHPLFLSLSPLQPHLPLLFIQVPNHTSHSINSEDNYLVHALYIFFPDKAVKRARGLESTTDVTTEIINPATDN